MTSDAGLALVYHRVGPKRETPERELLPNLDSRSFAAQLDWMGSRFRLVRASELLYSIAAPGADAGIPLALTFDDDLASHAEFVLPELISRGIPATFFLSGAALGGTPPRPWWELLEAAASRAPEEALGGLSVQDRAAAIEAMPPPQQAGEAERLEALAGPDPGYRTLDAEGIRRLAEAGMEIGFHTLGHHRLPDLGEAEVERELGEGRQRLGELVGREPSSIAYPHGAATPAVMAAARRAGYATGFTTAGTAIRRVSDPLDLARIYPPRSRIALAWRLRRTLRTKGP
jgi:peptidoglycan/xylan/chitin deacetylase (PgdA/CDA1 family)